MSEASHRTLRVVVADDGSLPPGGTLAAVRAALAAARLDVLEVEQVEPAPPGRPVRLTVRELAVLEGLCSGLDVVRTAHSLGITANTCRSYVRAILTKLDVQSQAQAVAVAYRRRLVSVPHG